MFRYISFHLVIGLTCLMLASCAAIKEKTTTEPIAWPEHQQQRQKIKVWEIRGRLGVQTQTTGGSVDIIWKQSDQDYSIRLILPLSVGSYLIQGNDRYAEIRYPNGRKKIVSNIDNVFTSMLGRTLPVNAIRDWVRGLPARSLSVEKMEWDEQGLLSSIDQSGWSVEMADYSGNDLLLPHTLYIRRSDDDELDIRLLLRQWLVDG